MPSAVCQSWEKFTSESFVAKVQNYCVKRFNCSSHEAMYVQKCNSCNKQTKQNTHFVRPLCIHNHNHKWCQILHIDHRFMECLLSATKTTSTKTFVRSILRAWPKSKDHMPLLWCGSWVEVQIIHHWSVLWCFSAAVSTLDLDVGHCDS